MKITHVTTTAIVREVKKPAMDGMWTYDAGGLLVVRVHTDEGITGYATSNFGRIKRGVYTLQALIEG